MTQDMTDGLQLLVEATARLPFNQHLGVTARRIEPGFAESVLAADDRVGNHIGGVHAIAELAPAESAAANAVTSRLVPLVREGWVPIAKRLSVTYTAPAEGELVATAEFPADEGERLVEAGRRGERVAAVVPVTVRAGETVVAEAEVEFVFKPLA